MSRALKIRKDWAGRLIASAFPASFAVFHQFVFAPPTEGWWHVYAMWIAQGRAPYRDFELLVGPLYPLFIAVLSALGLESFFALRIVGVLMITLIALAIHELIQGPNYRIGAGLAAATAAVFVQLGVAHIGYDYIYLAILLVLGAAFFVKKALVAEASSSGWFFAAGISLALAVLTKHSLGFVAVGIFFFATLFSAPWLRGKFLPNFSSVRDAISLSSGIVAGLSPVVAWAISGGFLSAMFQEFMLSSAQTKGGLGLLLSRVQGVFGPTYTLEGLRIISVCLAIGFLAFQIRNHSLVFPRKSGLIKAHRVQISLLTAIGVGGSATLLISPEITSLFLRQVAFTGGPLVSILVLVTVLLRRLPSSFLSVTLASLSLVAGTVMSSGLGELSVFLSLGLVLGLFAYWLGDSWVSLLVLSTLLLALTLSGAVQKSQSPFAWWGLAEKFPQDVSERLETGLGSGLIVEASVAERERAVFRGLEGVHDCIGEVVAFPHVPKYVLDSGQTPGGRLAMYWFDFSSAEAILIESQRIRNAEICGLVLFHPPDYVWEGHRDLFWGQTDPSPHFVLYETLLLKSRSMVLTEEIVLSGGWKADVFVKE